MAVSLSSKFPETHDEEAIYGKYIMFSYIDGDIDNASVYRSAQVHVRATKREDGNEGERVTLNSYWAFPRIEEPSETREVMLSGQVGIDELEILATGLVQALEFRHEDEIQELSDKFRAKKGAV